MLPEYVWDAGVLEGNPFTFPEVETLLEGVTVGGRKLLDQEQILNLAESSRYLIELVKRSQFRLDKETFCSLNARVARNEALEWGHFRGEGPETAYTPDVGLGKRGRYTPLATEQGAGRLNEVFSNGLRALHESLSNPFEKAAAIFLFGALQPFFFDGNKRTSRFMMNGVLMTEGIDAISIPAVRATAFNSRMVDFYLTRDATEMMAFVLDCHPQIALIRQLNPGLSVIKDLPNIEYHRLSDSMAAQASRAAPEASVANADSPHAVEKKGSDQLPEGFVKRPSLAETRREAAESWRRDYHDKRPNDLGSESTDTKENTPDGDKTRDERDAGLDCDRDR
jgi:hypothetical protein